MLFDQLCGIAEKRLPELIPLLKEARIFRLPPDEQPTGSIGEVLHDWEDDTRLIENFRLPFPVVVFEETATRQSCGGGLVLLAATSDEQQGEDPLPRVFAFAVMLSNEYVMVGALQALPCGQLYEDPERIVPARLLGGRAFRINPWQELPELSGSRIDMDLLEEMELAVQRLAADLQQLQRQGRHAEAIEIAKQSKDAVNQFMVLQCLRAAGQGVFHTMYVNTPSRFIVEERPLKLNDKIKNPKRLLRSTHRPHYITLKPSEIKTKLLGAAAGTGDEAAATDPDEPGRKVRPHERRGHFRRLSSERFKEARGKVIWIDAMWVGPQTAVQGKNRYTVLLDK